MGLLVGRVEEGIDHSKMKHVGRYTKRGGAEYWVMIKKGFVLWTGVLTIQTVSLLAPAFFFFLCEDFGCIKPASMGIFVAFFLHSVGSTTAAFS